jgi:hypothetical protein
MKTVLLASAAIFAMSAGASAATHPGAVAHVTAHHIVSGVAPGSTTLYDQNGNDNGVGLVSQNFESAFDAYDAQSADDFKVPSGHKWSIKEVDVTGVYFNGYGPARDVNVFVYKDKKGLPGKLVQECDNAPITSDNGGSFVIKIPKSCKIHVKEGTYWLSVQANLDFGAGGEWGWEGNSVQTGNPYAFQNPGNGFATGCTTWGSECLGYGPDFMFALKGKDATL